MTAFLSMPRSVYVQQGNLLDALLFLSRTLARMEIRHVVTGAAALALYGYSQRIQMIDLLVTSRGLERIQKILLNQRLTLVDADSNLFWDIRTGYSIKLHLVEEFSNYPHLSLDEMNVVTLDEIPTLPLELLLKQRTKPKVCSATAA
ncbi:hypothetical protein ACN4EG_08335 [Alkalinema pantanalense CENA528]|uniref:hypothetical protein n=1 Tax=Alkalinema pantanalense TaxID=1620705 RepID=UPI003D6FFE9D